MTTKQMLVCAMVPIIKLSATIQHAWVAPTPLPFLCFRISSWPL